ncbi:hypothetical protein [Thalassiella azotivora]
MARTGRRTAAVVAGAVGLTVVAGAAVAAPRAGAGPVGAVIAAATRGADEDAPGGGAGVPEELRESRLAHVAERLGEALAGLVDDGTITQEQADAVAEHLAERGPGGHGMGGHGMGGHGTGILGAGLTAAADELGMDVDALRDALREGSTLGEVADAQGVDRDDLVDGLVARATERVADLVRDGRLTRGQADELLADLPDRVTALLDAEAPAAGGPGHRPGHGHGDGPRGWSGSDGDA